MLAVLVSGVQGLGLRDSGLGVRVEGSGFRVLPASVKEG